VGEIKDDVLIIRFGKLGKWDQQPEVWKSADTAFLAELRVRILNQGNRAEGWSVFLFYFFFFPRFFFFFFL
jgi:hypothetical protein